MTHTYLQTSYFFKEHLDNLHGWDNTPRSVLLQHAVTVNKFHRLLVGVSLQLSCALCKASPSFWRLVDYKPKVGIVRHRESNLELVVRTVDHNKN